MAKISFDLSKYKDRFGGYVPPGEYVVSVEDVEAAESKAGNSMLNVTLRVEEGESTGVRVVTRLVLTENSLFRLVNFLQAIKLPTERKRYELDVKAILGKRCIAVIQDSEPYNGRVRPDVLEYRAIAGAASSPSSATVTDDLDDLDTPDPTPAPKLAVVEETPEPEGKPAEAEVTISDPAPEPEPAPEPVGVAAAAAVPAATFQEVSLDDIDLG